MKPAFSVMVGGTAANLNDRLLLLEVIDQEGSRSDTCRIIVDDRDGRVAIPSRGASISISLGYRETGVSPMGSFVVDEVTANGWPRQMEIVGRSADLTQGLKAGRSFSYKNMSIDQIVQQIAGRHGLSASGGSGISGNFKHIAQTEESDMNFLTRLAMRHDATFAIKNGQLIFRKRGTSGGSVTARAPGNLIEYRLTLQDRQQFDGGSSEWWDRGQAKRMREGGGGGGNNYMVSPLAEDGQGQSSDMAGSAGSSHSRATKQVSVTILGNPAAMAEGTLVISGAKPGVDGSYRIKSATHILDNTGYKTIVEGEGT